jgi:hypothetical protein
MSHIIHPCPFCGSSDVVLRYDDNWYPKYIECDVCGCIGPRLSGLEGTIEAAALGVERKWNTRTGTVYNGKTAEEWHQLYCSAIRQVVSLQSAIGSPTENK